MENQPSEVDIRLNELAEKFGEDRDKIKNLESNIRFLKKENEQLESQIEELKNLAEGAYSYADDADEIGKEAYEIAWGNKVELSKLECRIEELEEVSK